MSEKTQQLEKLAKAGYGIYIVFDRYRRFVVEIDMGGSEIEAFDADLSKAVEKAAKEAGVSDE